MTASMKIWFLPALFFALFRRPLVLPWLVQTTASEPQMPGTSPSRGCPGDLRGGLQPGLREAVTATIALERMSKI